MNTRPCQVRTATLGFLLLLLVPMSAQAWDAPPAEVEAYSSVTSDFTTPHTPWARPNAQGGLRGLYLLASGSEGMQTHAREAAELMQRLDLELDLAYWYSFHKEQWFCGDIGTRRLKLLMRRPQDVFIFQDVSPARLPDQNDSTPSLDARADFLAAVQAGAGVVLIGTDDGKLLSEAQAANALPPCLAGTGALKTWTLGKGRIVQMPERPKIAYSVGWEVEYDYWQEKVTRAVLWAAHREPRVTIALASPARLDRQALPAKNPTVTWKGAAAKTTELAVRLRRWDGATLRLGTVPCDDAEGSAAFEIPRVRAGAYHLEVQARSPAGYEGWTIAPLEVTTSLAVATIRQDQKHPLPQPPTTGKMPKWTEAFGRRGVYVPYVETGDPITGEVELSGDLAGCTLRISLMDPGGRELLRRDSPAQAKQAYAFTTEEWMPMLLRIEAVVVKDGAEVVSDYRFQRIARRQHGRFNFVLWSLPGDETLGPYAIRRLAELGVTVGLEHTAAPISAAAHGISYVPWSGGGGNVIARNAEDWADPDVGKGWAEMVGIKSRGHGVFCYSLGDEITTAAMGKGPKTEAGFRRFLQEAYGELPALNRSWGATFGSWDDITVAVSSKQADTAAAAKAAPANLAPAFDLAYFPGWNFIQMGKSTRDWIRKTCGDPQARIGFEGSGQLGKFHGCDPELICREFDMWVPYAGIAEEFIRSVAPRRFIRSAWMGYDRDAASFCGHYWRSIMMGNDSVWYWMWSAIGAWTGFQGPNLEPPPPVREMLDDTRVVREGLGDLLLQYGMQHDGIAMLYSYASVYAGGDKRNASYLTPWAAFHTWDFILHDLNLQYNFVTDRMLASEDFAKSGYKVLVLPHALCLSRKAAEAVRRFAEAGGTVVADTRAGYYDERCKPYDKAALDELFGIKGGFEPGVAVEAAIDGKLGLQSLAWSPSGTAGDRKVVVDPTVTLAGGAALGKAGQTPLCIVNTVGKGRAILLNLAVRSSMPVRDYEGNLDAKPDQVALPEDAARFFLGLLHAAGVERAFTVVEHRKEKVPFFPNTRVQRWRNGDYQIVGLFRQSDTEARRAAVIPDSEKWPVSPERQASGRPYAPYPWVYDIKHGLTVGPANWFIVDLPPGKAAFYVLLPGPLPPMVVELPKQAKRGAPITLKLSVPQARGLHAIKLRARLPDGTPATFWNQTVQVAKEPLAVTLPLAFNDPVGQWQIVVTDLFGSETEQAVTVRVE